MNNKTTTQTEYLSAFLDDEAGTFEQRRLLDEIQKDDELQQKVAHFSLIGEAIRNEKSCLTVKANFLSGIHEQLAEEPAYEEVYVNKAKAANQSSWLRPITGMALAASLAAVAVVAINLNTKDVPASAVTNIVASNADIAAKVSTQSDSFSSLDTAWRNRLKRYVNNHAKYASTHAIMPSVRAASYVSSY